MFIKLDSDGNIQSKSSYFDDLYLCEETSDYSIYLDKYGYIYIKVSDNNSNLSYYNQYAYNGGGNSSNHGKISHIGDAHINW